MVPAVTAPLAPLAGEAEEEGEEVEEGEGGEGGEGPEWIEEVHEAAANLLFVLAALHIGGVLFETRRMGPLVIRRMTGGVRG